MGSVRIRGTRPIAEQPPGCGKHRVGRHVAGHDQRGVVGHVVLALNGAHLLGRRLEDHRALAERILATPGRTPERLPHRRLKRVPGVGLGSIVLSDHHRTLALQLIRPEERIAQRRCEKRHRRHGAVRWHREVVVDALFLRRAVEHRAELGCARDELLRLRIARVRLEEHVLVEVRQPLVRRRLREGTVARVGLDGHQRNAVVLHYDDLEAVGQRVPLDPPLQFGPLGHERMWGCREQTKRGGQRRA